MDLIPIEEIEQEVQERTYSSNLPQISFDTKPNTLLTENKKNSASDLIDSAFEQAIINRVATQEEVQEKILDSAEKVIDNKLNEIKANAEREDKAAHFNNKKAACECFGYNETTTEKWAVNLMNFWHNIMNAIWIGIGFITFAPVTFIAGKIAVIFKKAWLAVLIAIIIYLAVVLTPLLTVLLTK